MYTTSSQLPRAASALNIHLTQASNFFPPPLLPKSQTVLQKRLIIIESSFPFNKPLFLPPLARLSRVRTDGRTYRTSTRSPPPVLRVVGARREMSRNWSLPRRRRRGGELGQRERRGGSSRVARWVDSNHKRNGLACGVL